VLSLTKWLLITLSTVYLAFFQLSFCDSYPVLYCLLICNYTLLPTLYLLASLQFLFAYLSYSCWASAMLACARLNMSQNLAAIDSAFSLSNYSLAVYFFLLVPRGVLS
jgi:ABC-type microcin C transport system permease subunit YejE